MQHSHMFNVVRRKIAHFLNYSKWTYFVKNKKGNDIFFLFNFLSFFMIEIYMYISIIKNYTYIFFFMHMIKKYYIFKYLFTSVVIARLICCNFDDSNTERLYEKTRSNRIFISVAKDKGNCVYAHMLRALKR